MQNEIIRKVHVDPSERRYTFELIQDVEDILEHNQHLRSQSQKSDWGRHVANIPNVTMTDWFNEYNKGRGTPDLKMFGNPEFDEFVWRKLQSSEWLKLRVDK